MLLRESQVPDRHSPSSGLAPGASVSTASLATCPESRWLRQGDLVLACDLKPQASNEATSARNAAWRTLLPGRSLAALCSHAAYVERGGPRLRSMPDSTMGTISTIFKEPVLGGLMREVSAENSKARGRISVEGSTRTVGGPGNNVGGLRGSKTVGTSDLESSACFLTLRHGRQRVVRLRGNG